MGRPTAPVEVSGGESIRPISPMFLMEEFSMIAGISSNTKGPEKLL
jgi:hypothetical protein